jgi:hypothetical protein
LRGVLMLVTGPAYPGKLLRVTDLAYS